MRTLWYVPIMHTTDETFIGSEMARTSKTLRLTLAREDRRIMLSWERLQRQMDGLIRSGTIRPRKLLVFRDSLPHPLSRYPEILRKSRNKGRAPTFRLMMRLQTFGARICGTEDPGLIVAYGQYAMARLGDPSLRRDARLQDDMIALRDLWTANHIARILRHGSDAILFMGAAHHVDRYLRILAPDITIRYLRAIVPRRP